MKNKFRYVLIVLFGCLIIFELIIFDYNSGFNWKSLLHVVSPVLMIIAMILSIKHVNKHGEH